MAHRRRYELCGVTRSDSRLVLWLAAKDNKLAFKAMHEQLRLIRLVALARLRSAGWVPWLLVLGWLAAASYQEPLLFRRYGIYLVDDAAWTGGAVVLIVLLLAERRLPRRGAAIANLVTVAAISVLQVVGSYLADQSPWQSSFSSRAMGCLLFFAAWAPLGLTLSRNTGSCPRAQLLGKLVVLSALVMGSMLAVALRSSPDTNVIGASVLAFLGAACWASKQG